MVKNKVTFCEEILDQCVDHHLTLNLTKEQEENIPFIIFVLDDLTKMYI